MALKLRATCTRAQGTRLHGGSAPARERPIPLRSRPVSFKRMLGRHVTDVDYVATPLVEPRTAPRGWALGPTRSARERQSLEQPNTGHPTRRVGRCRPQPLPPKHALRAPRVLCLRLMALRPTPSQPQALRLDRVDATRSRCSSCPLTSDRSLADSEPRRGMARRSDEYQTTPPRHSRARE